MTGIPSPSSPLADGRRPDGRPRRPVQGALVLAMLAACAAALPAGPPALARPSVGVAAAAHPGDGTVPIAAQAVGPVAGQLLAPAAVPGATLTLPGGLVLPASVLLPAGRPSTAYVAPVHDPVVRARFEPPEMRWSAGHRGVDLAAPVGTVVRSPGPGVVVHASPVVDRGVLTVRHPDGLRSSLEPVAAQVEVGTVVAAGDPLGVVQDAPNRTHCTPRCLHWGVRDGRTYLDPLSLLPSEPVVLLPLGASAPP